MKWGDKMVPFKRILLFTLIAIHKELFNSSVDFPASSDISAVLRAKNRRIAILIDSELEIPQDRLSESEINSNLDYPAFFLPGKMGITLNGESFDGLYLLYSDGFLRSIGDELGNIIFTNSEKNNSAPVASQLESIIIECLTHELRHEYQFFEKSKALLNLNDLKLFFSPEEEKAALQKWNSLRELYSENTELELDAFIIGSLAKLIWQKNLVKKQKLDLIKKKF
jgi:hypothetical protein